MLHVGSDQADRKKYNKLTHNTGCFWPLKATFYPEKMGLKSCSTHLGLGS